MSRFNEAIIGAIFPFYTSTSSSLPFSLFTLKSQCDKGSSEVDKMVMWSEMLPEMLEEISDRLPLRDFISFRGVCKKWQSARSGRSEITSFSKEGPWLLFYGFDRRSTSGVDENTCYLYNRPNPNCCTIRLPHLRDATLMHSEAGWLFARNNNDAGQIFLYKPLTLTRIDLPKHIVTQEQVCTMTIPKSEDLTVFILSRRTDSSALEISSCRIGDSEWKSHTEEISKDLIGTMLAAYWYNREACGEKTICIHGSERYLVYDYLNRRCVKVWPARDKAIQRAQSGKLLSWEKDLDFPVHHKNWLERFGEKGAISISTCSLSTKRDGHIGVTGGCKVIAGQSGLIVGHKLVRASWVEPRF